MSILMDISEAMQRGRRKLVVENVKKAIEEGYSAKQILEEGLLSGMDIVGQKFKNNEIFVPEVLMAAKSMSAGTEILKPLMSEEGAANKGKACIGTVKGDLHDIGKNLVRMMLEGKGIEVIDLGVDVEPEAFVKAVKENGCKIIACSALLTTTMPAIADVIKATEEAGIRNDVKIMIGGAPVTQEFANEVGADAYTADAATAAEVAANFLA